MGASQGAAFLHGLVINFCVKVIPLFENSDIEVYTFHFNLLFGHNVSFKSNKTVTKTDINNIFASSGEHSLTTLIHLIFRVKNQ